MSGTVNIFAQFGILAALLIGIMYVKRLRYGLHGYLTFFAVALNILSVVLVMLPSMVGILSGASLSTFTVIVGIHSVLGLVALAVGMYIVLVWRFRKPGVSCFRLRWSMGPLAAAWVVTMILGVLMYLILYTGLSVPGYGI